MSNYNRSSRRRNGGEGRKRMSLGAAVAIIVSAFMSLMVVFAGLAFASKGFQNGDVGTWFEKELNPDNLIKEENYIENLEDEFDNGLKIDWKDNGEIRLSGKVEDKTITGDQTPDPIPFTSVTLEPGKVYILSSGNTKHADDKTFGIEAQWLDKDGNAVEAKAADDDLKIDLTSHTEAVTVTLSVYYENEVTYFGINSYLRPILVEDGKDISFFK